MLFKALALLRQPAGRGKGLSLQSTHSLKIKALHNHMIQNQTFQEPILHYYWIIQSLKLFFFSFFAERLWGISTYILTPHTGPVTLQIHELLAFSKEEKSLVTWNTQTCTHTHHPLQTALSMGWRVAAGCAVPGDRTKHSHRVCVCMPNQYVCVICACVLEVQGCMRNEQKRPSNWGRRG